MADIIKDKLSLNYSDSFSIADIEEKDINLVLEESSQNNCTIIGTITNENGNPESGVTIKLFDSNGTPFKHTITESTGKYAFNNLEAGNYYIACVNKDSRLSIPQSIIAQVDEVKTIDFEIIKDNSISLCTIAGVLTDNDSNKRLGSAIVSLLDENTNETIATTLTADDGEYVFYDIPAGSYNLVASTEGYYPSSTTSITASSNKIVNAAIRIIKNPTLNVGTVSGVIRNNSKQPIEGAYVGLYEITTVEGKVVETLVATTRTNSVGIYMFGSVGGGDYIVKAKKLA